MPKWSTVDSPCLLSTSGFYTVKWKSLTMTPPGRDANKLQASPLQKLVLILLTSQGWKAESTWQKDHTNNVNIWLSLGLNPGPRGLTYHTANPDTYYMLIVQ